MMIDSPVTSVKGVGPKKAEALDRLGIHTMSDLLYFYPRDYEDRRSPVAVSDLVPGEPAFVKAVVISVVKTPGRYRKKQILKVLAEDSTGRMEAVFFNASFLARDFTQGEVYCFYGKPTSGQGHIQMIHPEFAKADSASGEIVPVYPLTSGITQREIRKLEKAASQFAGEAEEDLPDEVIKDNALCDIGYALSNIHFPETMEALRKAKYRLIYDELFVMHIGLLMMRTKCSDGIAFSRDGTETEYQKYLPYELTGAQKRVVKEIAADMESHQQMNRLIQGDVGSGKTAVAECALYKAVKSGYQGAFMAPTELLARQHFKTLSNDLGPLGVRIGFLSGHLSKSEKDEVAEGLRSGTMDIVIGTHALIQPSVEFSDLGLVITDEQHRFGVNQRALLSEKGNDPDILVMTATPIPRTLAVIMYGDIDISVLDEMPPGRQEILTKAVTDKSRGIVYDFLRGEISRGRQAYVVAPLIDKTEDIDARSVTEVYDELKKKFPEFRIALLHGQMNEKEKDAVMEEFAAGGYDILVATVVIEVGIDVANATVMVIENAERFGLAQLHQLRGRVGRGREQSYCVLISNGEGQVSKDRARTMVESSDGFYIAEKDLELRGPGEFFGTRQHGIPDMQLADLVKHMDIMEAVRGTASEVLRDDPELTAGKNTPLRKRVEAMFGRGSIINI